MILPPATLGPAWASSTSGLPLALPEGAEEMNRVRNTAWAGGKGR